MSKIELTHIDKYYGKNHVLKDLNLTIEDGDFMTLLGPSGCGKTTTLRVVSGLEKPQNGIILMDGKEIVNAAEASFAPPSKRNLNLVFQSYALWPHMTVFDNMAFGLKLRKTPKDEIKRRVEEAARVLGIDHLLNRKPKALSGGQRQRVALGRAMSVSRRSSCSTNRCPTWTLSCACRCVPKSPSCISACRPPSSTLPMTRPKL